MPLTNEMILGLNEITLLVQDKSNVTDSEIRMIKEIFGKMLKDGYMYNVEEIESWFENEGSWNNKDARTRITNLSHYIQSRYEQGDRLKIVQDKDESCGC